MAVRQYTIGSFARLVGVSVKALRYYAAKGLIVPAAVDPRTGYRYYTADQLCDCHEAIALLRAGLTMQDVIHLLNTGVPHLTLRSALLDARARVQARIASEALRLADIDHRLESLPPVEESDALADSLRVRFTYEPAIRVVGLRAVVDRHARADELLRDLVANGVASIGLSGESGPVIVRGIVWHDCGQQSGVIECEGVVALPIETCWPLPLTCGRALRVYDLPGSLVAQALCPAEDEAVGAAYAALRRTSAAAGLVVTGPAREWYTRPTAGGDNEGAFVTCEYPVAPLERAPHPNTKVDAEAA
jgi:DNA-binding transcriptional MerR regulator